ncbi:protein Shroom isoform X2 [Drosophila guanche]|uniref:protein Shroom isoform X2 n=1 Tax=Drosophila guanche TaxID=7266 RepID=UPI00147206F9|nr:protein Shroom isoform X2 [Drosophila guanche]
MKMVFGGKFRIRRSTSKAKYLPRQSHDKLNNTDPDHGIYKLTLTSNEDLVAHTKPSYGVSGGKLPNNLPDVLPLGVKLQQQPAKPQPGSPNGEGNVTLRYGSNNNLATKSPTNAAPHYTMIYGQAMAGHGGQRYSTPPLGHGYGKATPPQHYTRSQSYDVKQTSVLLPAQQKHLMTQSHVDLKQAVHDLETTLEEAMLPPPTPTATPTETPTPTPPRLSPATSNSDCSLSSHNSSLECSIIPNKTNANTVPTPEAHIFRAEVISTTLTNAPKPAMNRQESLRENIEKITQLQSQLMSAHLCDSGLLGGCGYTASVKLANNSPSPSPSTELALSLQPPPSPPSPPPVEEQPIEVQAAAVEGLQLMQRSELVLMVSAKPSTTDMACQTDEMADRDTDLVAGREEQQTRTTLQPRQRQAIELDYENLSSELLKLLAPNDKLVDILTPKSCKPTSHYVSNLYNPNVPLRLAKRDVGTSTLMRMKAATAAPETTKVVSVELQLGDASCEGANVIKQKLDELIKRLNQKIGALKHEQQTIGEECATNDKLGHELFAKLAESVRPSQASKFRTYIDDVGHITSLLLSLSERLSHTECSLETRQQDKSVLESKRTRLYEQLEEAQRLKADIDRRGSSIAGLLGKHLSADLCADYDYFINMKAKLIADARDLADRIKGGEEQLGALTDALVQSDC